MPRKSRQKFVKIHMGFFEICLQPRDSFWMKQTVVVVSFEVRCDLYILLCLYVIEHSCISQTTLTRMYILITQLQSNGAGNSDVRCSFKVKHRENKFNSMQLDLIRPPKEKAAIGGTIRHIVRTFTRILPQVAGLEYAQSALKYVRNT